MNVKTTDIFIFYLKEAKRGKMHNETVQLQRMILNKQKNL